MSTRKQRASRNTYSDFINADYGHRFHVYLGVDCLPKFERCDDHSEHHGKFRMTRRFYHPDTRHVCGQWCATRKEAKASYKEALRENRRLRALSI